MEPTHNIEVIGEEAGSTKVSVKAGQLVMIRTIIMHPMPVLRADKEANKGSAAQRVTRLLARYNDQQVFQTDFKAGVSANPYITFFLLPPKSGTLIVSWQDNLGQSWSTNKEFVVA